MHAYILLLGRMGRFARRDLHQAVGYAPRQWLHCNRAGRLPHPAAHTLDLSAAILAF